MRIRLRAISIAARLFCHGNKHRPQRGCVFERPVEEEAPHRVSGGEIDAFGIDARQLPLAGFAICEANGVIFHRVDMILVHVLDRPLLHFAERGEGSRCQKVVSCEPVCLAKAAVEQCSFRR